MKVAHENTTVCAHICSDLWCRPPIADGDSASDVTSLSVDAAQGGGNSGFGSFLQTFGAVKVGPTSFFRQETGAHLPRI